MIDLIKIKVSAGSGGDGDISFYKLKNMRHGKPDGGDGGKGGDVFLESDPNLYDLEFYRGKNGFSSEDGGRGGKSQRKGKNGEDVVLKVPIGTIVKLMSSRATEGSVAISKRIASPSARNDIIIDIKTPGQKVLVALGGIGGRGNFHARGKRDRKGQKPNHWDSFNVAEKGKAGEEADVILELKYIAQVGIIGLPSAGKSTLLSVLTNATPKIGDYPFTTLEPNIGVMRDSGQAGMTVLADIPGIIEGASVGKGLGLTFLRHIERTTLLIHLLDASLPNIKENYETVRNELKYYGHDLDKKKELIVLNKIDLNPKVKKIKGSIVISAKEKKGLEELKKCIMEMTGL